MRPHMEVIERLVTVESPPKISPHSGRSTKQKKNPSPSATSTVQVDTSDDTPTPSTTKRRSTRKKESELAATVTTTPVTSHHTLDSRPPGGSSVSAGGSVASASSGGTDTPSLSTNSSMPATNTSGSHGQSQFHLHHHQPSQQQNTPYPQLKQSHQILRQLHTWRLVPEPVYFEQPVPVSLIYGGVHLARLLVRLPDLFVKMRFPNRKLKYVHKFLEFLVDYLSSQEDIFLESNYASI